MINEILIDVHKYLLKVNKQFNGELIEQEELGDLLDNINDLPEEMKGLATALKELAEIDEYSQDWNTFITKNKQELHDSNVVYGNVLDIYSTLEDAFEAVKKVGVARNQRMNIPKDDEDYYDFGKANTTYEVEGNEEMEMVSKEGMAALREELFQLRKYKAGQEGTKTDLKNGDSRGRG